MTCAVAIHNKFLAPLPRKVLFGVWIDILAKEKFSNLNKKFISYFHLFMFVASLLHFIYFLFFIFLQGAKNNDR